MENKPLLITILFLFGIFLVLYLTQATGYYEYKTNQKTTLTNSAIKQFEKDVKEGKNIDINNYKKEEKSNKNKISDVTLNISKNLEKILDKSIKIIFKSISKTVEG